MNCDEQCFGCHGLYDVDDDIANSRRSSLDALIEDLDVEKLDISTIRDFYDQYKKSYDTPLCWDCALFRVLGYSSSIYLTIASISQTTPNAQPTTRDHQLKT